MLVAAIAPPVAFTVYLLSMFLLLWCFRRRIKRRRRVVRHSPIRASVDLEGERNDVEGKQYSSQPQRPPALTFASSILEVPMSPSINSATPFAAPSRGYSGVMSISPVPSSPISPTSPIGTPLTPLRAPHLTDNLLPARKSAASRNSRFHISVPAFVGRLSGGGIPTSTGGGGGAGAGTVGFGGTWGAGTGGEGESGGLGGGRRMRRQSRADPVLPRTTTSTPTLRFNSDDMLAPRRPRPPSIRKHIMHSPRVTAATAALLASTTTPPPNSPLPPTPLAATLTSASPSSPMQPTPVLSMLPRFAASSSSKMKDKTRIRPLPPLPLQHQLGLSSASPRLQLPPPPSSQPPPPPQSQSQPQQPQLQSPQAVTTTATTATPPSGVQAIVLQPNRLHSPGRKEKKEREAAGPSSSLSRPLQRQNYPFTRLVGHRRRRAHENDSPPPYTSQYFDSDTDADQPSG